MAESDGIDKTEKWPNEIGHLNIERVAMWTVKRWCVRCVRDIRTIL